jgi:hypothetical protein
MIRAVAVLVMRGVVGNMSSPGQAAEALKMWASDDFSLVRFNSILRRVVISHVYRHGDSSC